VHPLQTQALLRDTFTRWGLPARLRVDNGTPWGAGGGLPPALVLWLAGLGVDTRHNRACTPQDNGVIEQSHGTAKRWGEPWLCRGAGELQARLEKAERRQREAYPYRRGKSRLETFPQLRHSGREYDRGREEESWDLRRAEGRLAEVVEARRVDKVGCVSLYSRNVYVGRSWANQMVYVRYDPQGQRWMFSDERGQLVNHQSASEISRERIRDLTASDGRSKRNGPT
jgi:transposase InsO family protein